MSILVLTLPTRHRLRARGLGTAESSAAAAGDEIGYLLSNDGFTIQAQGRCAPALLPKADSVVAIVNEADIAWHRIVLPKAPAARLRAALVGVLEEGVLDEPETTHLAVAPDAAAGQPTWVAAIHRPWLQAELARLERRQVFVDRVVPAAWPDDPPTGHFTEAASPAGEGSRQGVVLTWAHTDGVAMLRTDGSLARALLPQPLPIDARWTATPEVATTAERWLGSPVVVISPAERALQATRSLWNLRQFDLAARNRGTRAARDLLRQWSSPAWRPVRIGLLGLVAAQVIGLNLWAWRQRSEVTAQQREMVSLLQRSFPQVQAVLDAPLQMQREVESLRTRAGKPSEVDFETALQAAASAWPAHLPPVENLYFELGQLTVAVPQWSAADIEQFSAQLRPTGWQAQVSDGRLVLSRSAQGALP